MSTNPEVLAQMEYENCPQSEPLSSRMLMYAVIALLVLIVLYYSSQPKQHAVGVRNSERGGEWIHGVYVHKK